MSNRICGNCESPIEIKSPSSTFVLDEHLCAKCQENVTTLKVILTRATPHVAWGLESAQPLRVNFQVPGREDESTNRTPIPETFG